MLFPSQRIIHRFLSSAEVTVNGTAPGDLQIHDQRFYDRVFLNGSLGLGESYMDGWWDCDQIDVFITKILLNGTPKWARSSWPAVLGRWIARLTNYQKTNAFGIGKAHYDRGNAFYKTMLGDTLVYSCGYWKDAGNLDEAQNAKMDLICRKLHLKPGQRI